MLIRPNGDPHRKGTWSRMVMKVGKDIPPDALEGQLGGAGLYIAHELEKCGAPIRVSTRRLHGVDTEWAEYLGKGVEMKTVRALNKKTQEYETYLYFEWENGWENADKIIIAPEGGFIG